MTQPPSPAPPPEGVRPPPGPAPAGHPPQQRQPGYAPPPGRPGWPGYPPPPGYPGGPAPAGWPGPVPAPPALSPAGQPLASFLDRLLAFLVDSAVFAGVALVLAVPTFVVYFVVVGPDLFVTRSDGTLVEPNPYEFLLQVLLIEAALIAVIMILSYVYYVEMIRRTGQTVGKRVMKIRIVTLDPAGSLDRGVLARRFLVQHVAGALVPGLSYLDGLWQLWDKPYQQCLHDKVARTLVVKVPA